MLLNNRYQVLQALGSGGFGETFVAEDTQMPSKRRCLIKRLHPVNNEPKVYQLINERFHREAAILEDLGSGSDRIPSLYAYFEENGNFYLVQELIEGKTLSAALQDKGSFSEAYVKNFLINLLPVIEYVHSKRIVHRDINPDNIIIRKHDNQPVLIDFGAVKESMGTTITASGNVTGSIMIGTPGFMPSEQVAGRPVYSSDLYAVGLTAIYMLTGKLPQTIEIDHRTGEILWKQYAQRISPTLASILDKSIHCSAHERYSTAQEMLQALPQKTVQKPLTPSHTVVLSPGNNRLPTISYKSPSRLDDLQKTLILASFLAAAVIAGFWITRSNYPIISSSLSPSPSPLPSLSPSPSSSPSLSPSPSSLPSSSPSPTSSFAEQSLLGIWYSENSCSEPNFVMNFRGTTEFFRNSSYTYIGEVTVSGSSNGRNYSMTFDVNFTGEWNLDNDVLVSKLIDLKSQPTRLSADGEQINVQQLDQNKIKELPRLEDFVPKGSSSEETILELSNSKIVTRTKGSSCQTISEYSRRDRTFR